MGFEENSLSLQTVLNNRDEYNLAIPFTDSCRINPFYKLNVSKIYVDTSTAADNIYKVGSRCIGENKWEDIYSLKKPFLNRLATEAGIQFAPGVGDVVKVDENTWKSSAFGALKLPDGNIRTSNNFKVIDLIPEERKYRILYEEKATKGITDHKAAREASEKYAGQWVDTGKKNGNGSIQKKYVIEPNERSRYIEASLLDAMTQLRANAPQKAATGAMLRVIRDLLGIKGTYTMAELKKPFAIARTAFSPDYNDPVIKQMMLQQALQSIGNLFGNTSPVIQSISIPQNRDDEEAVDMVADITEGQDTEETLEGFSEEDRSRDFYCEKCGVHIEERVWDYSVEKFNMPLCYKCQKALRSRKGAGR